MTGFHYKCPLCNSIEFYPAKIEQLIEASKNPDAIITGRCKCCSHIWAKYSRVVFGEEEPEGIKVYMGEICGS